MSALWALIAPAGFRAETERELAWKGLKPLAREGDFFLFSGEPAEVAWAAVRWLRVERLPFRSIGEGARGLRPLARLWEHYPLLERGRGNLLHGQLRPYRRSTLSFPSAWEPVEGAGAFTLLEREQLLWCREFDRPDPLGEARFEENRKAPPSRAYLKLWEALALLGEWPGQGERTLDLGSSPGGWTWVLASLGASVLSVDRAPLEPAIASMPGVSYRKGDAFQLAPEESFGWVCSDVICAPDKLLGLARQWIESGRAGRLVFTLKFQGEADPATVAGFAGLGGRVLHLHHNKHELTFLWKG